MPLMEGRRFDHTKIRTMRRKMDFSQRELARESGIPLDTLRQYEQGRAAPSVERLFLIAETLRCSTDDFKTGV